MNDAENSDVDDIGGDAERRVRDVLAQQPSPGPMPAELFSRIETALLREQQTRIGEAPTGKLSVVPLGPSQADEPVASPFVAPPSSGRSTDGGSVVALDSRRRGRGLRALGIAAAVAAVVIGAGSLGVTALTQQDAPIAAAPIDVATLANRVTVTSTGQDYSAGGLPAQAATLLASPASMKVSPELAQQYGAMSTSRGVVSCVGSLGTALAANPDSIKVDLAKYDGAPAVAIVLTTAGTSTAWVVGRTCSASTGPLAGPTAVAT